MMMYYADRLEEDRNERPVTYTIDRQLIGLDIFYLLTDTHKLPSRWQSEESLH